MTSSNYYRIQYILLKLCTHFLRTNVYKSMFGIFFILFRSWVICKNKKRHGLYTLVFYILITTQHLSKTKILKTLWQTLLGRKRVQSFSKNINLCGSWNSPKFSIFQANNLVSRNHRAFLNLGIEFCITWLVLANYKKLTP